ncbi:MAG TPA: thioredoxin family protein [Anaerolineae bacterium]|nr:thioredoxin family protein [Anaerolineae bacterium]HPL28752.1 thioredoxin family protein [Anaerolineae bacterium]
MLEIQILGEGCPRCPQLEANVREALCELNVEAKVERVSSWWATFSYGVLAVPGLAINKHVRAQGCVPSKDAIMAWIDAALRGEPEAEVVCETCSIRR